MMLSVTEELHRAGKDKEVRAVVLRGEGKVFSSGHNLKEMTVETGYDYHKKIFDTCEAMMRLVGQIPVPVRTPQLVCILCTLKTKPNI